MKSIMIGAPSSGSGKTTITMGIIRALKKQGYNPCAFKTGPDYIDRAFLEAAAQKPAGNLDMYLQGKEGMLEALSLSKGDICIIEGVMGYYDGIYNDYENSSYDIAKTLDINSVLIYTLKGEMFTAIPKIKGMVEFEDSHIKGIVINGVSKTLYEMIKPQIEKYIDIKVLGFIPKLEEIGLESRHLGLIQSEEIDRLPEIIDRISEEVTKNVNLKDMISIASEMKSLGNEIKHYDKRNIKIAIAKDKAFSFYYTENLELLKRIGHVTFFSPLKDKELPDCDFLYLGGGYPEVFKQELSNNKTMLNSVKSFAENGGCILAECGGFMYLTEEIEGCRMVGIFKGKAKMTKNLQRFGYIDVILRDNCLLGNKGDRLTAHEFHRSVCEIEGNPILNIKSANGKKEWECGFVYKNVYAGYPHINFLGNIDMFEKIIDRIEEAAK